MKIRLGLAFVFLVLLGVTWSALMRQERPRLLDATYHHLGDDPTPDWKEASVAPEGSRLELSFDGRAIDGETVLAIVQRNVDDPWHVSLNGTRVATLKRVSEQVEMMYPIPAGVLVDGENRLSIECEKGTDDITLGNIRLFEQSLREALDLRTLIVSVSDGDTGATLPARVTVVDEQSELVPIYYAEHESTAVREGVVYLAGDAARLELPAGAYTIYASRGTEWSLARSELELHLPEFETGLVLRREVDTTGYVACDTHVHTLTHSGHGDASVEERQVTLAGEGVELAIATDHNHNTDYRPTQVALGLSEYFTPVVGNEVTTPIGHFNAFPLDAADEIPEHDLHDVTEIVRGIREKGAEVVILNHPRWPDEGSPYENIDLHPYTGHSSWPHPYDAVELINSDTKEPQPMRLFTDWFALLNQGARVVAVASSDSHAVGVVVGQGRTYVKSSTDDPARIDVAECAANVRTGKSSLSLGIFADALMNGTHGMGELVPGAEEMGLEVTVRAPGWVAPGRVEVWVNGTLHAIEDVASSAGKPTDTRVAFEMQRPLNDAWVVCMVHGEDAGAPHWPNRNDYTLAVTNPIYIDANGDGRYDPPRITARRMLQRSGREPEQIARVLQAVDEGVAIQVLDLLRAEYLEAVDEQIRDLGAGPAEIHERLREFLSGLSGQ